MFLKNKKYLFDGGSGQTLMEMGLETKGDLWSAQALLNENNHQMVVDMHKNFINAGSQLIVTSNFSVRRRLLKNYNLLDKFEFGIRSAGALALKAKNESDLLPFGQKLWNGINSKTIVYDLIYNPAPTPLLKFCANKGCMTIDGLQMLVAQGLKSLSFWTNGLEVPFHIMNDALRNHL